MCKSGSLCVRTDVEALASHREIHAFAERTFISGHLHALLAVELGAFETQALPAQRLTRNTERISKITHDDSVKI